MNGPDLPALDEDLAREVRRMERQPVRVLVVGLLGVGVMMGIDRYYNQQLSVVGWLAVVGVATLTLPLAAVLRALAQVTNVWAHRDQETRRALTPPEVPPKRPTTRPRTSPQNRSSEGRSRARLTPVPQDPPQETKTS